MPQIKAAEKKVRQSNKARALHAEQLSALRTSIKKFKIAKANNEDNVQELFNQAVAALDNAASKKLIHKNKANRDKSRLAIIKNK